MKNVINEINFKNEILIADGATGTNYFDDGLQAGDPPELWNIEKSQSVIELHRKFIQAGANIILTNAENIFELGNVTLLSNSIVVPYPEFARTTSAPNAKFISCINKILIPNVARIEMNKSLSTTLLITSL